MTMKILWHYNSHRHFEEYSLSSKFFNRSQFFKQHANVLVTCNNQNIAIEDLRAKCLYECEFDVVQTTNPQNGVHSGQLVSLNETYHRFHQYDYVIHTTPDVYLVDDAPLIALLQEELHSENHMIVDYHPYHPFCEQLYCTDFFVFKPNKTPNFWGDPLLPDAHCIESQLYKKIHELHIPHRIICRGKTSLHWQVDDYGLIHNHNMDIIKNILEHNIRPDQATAFSHNTISTK